MSKLTQTMHALSDINTTTADLLVKVLAESIEALLVEDGEANIPGVGKLKLVMRDARKGRNPQTGEEIAIPSKMTIKFVPGKALKDSINPVFDVEL